MSKGTGQKRIIRVFIASPGGLEDLRREFKRLIDQLNAGFGDGANVIFEALGWENTVSPVGRRVQSEINKDVATCDVFFLVMDKFWGRGSKTAVMHPVACLPELAKLRRSNTMEEFSLAMSRWESIARPLVFPIIKKLPADANRDAGPELRCILRLRRAFERSGKVLWHEWTTMAEFRGHADRILRRVARPSNNDYWGGMSPNAPQIPDYGPEFQIRIGELESELTKAREEKRAVEANAAFLEKEVKKLLPERAKSTEQFAKSRIEEITAVVERSGAVVSDLELAEHAAKAALTGKVEEARQAFSRALAETTDFRALFLGCRFYVSTGDLDEAERLMRRWLATIDLDSKNADLAAAYGNLGLIYIMRHDLVSAEKFHRQALTINEELDRHNGIAMQCENLGVVHWMRGESDQALQMHKRALEITESLGDRKLVSGICGNLAIVYLGLNELDSAESISRKGLAIDQEFGNRDGMASAYCVLATVAERRERLDQAEALYNEAIQIQTSLGDDQGLASTLSCIGLIHQKQGRPEQAMAAYEKAIAIYDNSGEIEGKADLYIDLGTLFLNQRKFDQAETALKKALTISQELGNSQSEASASNNLGALYQSRGALDLAVEMYSSAIAIDEKLGRIQEMAQTLANLGVLFETRGEAQKAREQWINAQNHFRRVDNESEVVKLQGWIDGLDKK